MWGNPDKLPLKLTGAKTGHRDKKNCTCTFFCRKQAFRFLPDFKV
jgi:hypothetical protein